MRREDYKNFDIAMRKSIFNSIYQFSRRIPVKYKTIIIDKRYTNGARTLRQRLSIEINKMIKEHEKYFNRFDKIVMYYDYKYKNKMSFTRGEKYFFSIEEIRKILKELNKKRF